MTDALLVADQHIDEGYFAPGPPCRGSLLSWPQTLVLGAFEEPQRFAGSRIPGSRTSNGDRETVDVRLRPDQEVFEHLAKSRERVFRTLQFHEETRWLAENKKRFAGQWIALQGRQLLAVGASAREVFLKVGNEKALPLVILVEGDEPPFAGW